MFTLVVPNVEELIALISQDCYMVRHYQAGRTAAHRLKRHQAIQKLGSDLRFAFSQTDDYETLIATVLDGLRPKDRLPPF